MSLVFTPFRTFRLALSTTLAAVTLASTAPLASAQVAIQGLFAIGKAHAEAAPYNFTGRVFDIDAVAFGSGTLLRRHTVQTAGHVVFDPTTGFLTYASFTRALYEDVSLSVDQIIAAQALSGYQAQVTADADFLTQSSLDLGIVLLQNPPVDENWGNYATTPSLLSTSPTFVLGYPGETFDGRTMAYVVPAHPWVALGAGTGSALYENDLATAEPGTSGGPIYVVPDGVHQYVEGSVVGTTFVDGTGEFNNFVIRAIDKQAGKFIADAEYTSGLIASVTLTGPKKVLRGHTYTYTATINFANPSRNGSAATTDRYSELKLKSNAANTKTTSLVSIVKTSNTTFDVTYTNNNRSGATTTLQIYYDKTATPLGKSSRIIKIQ